MISEAMTRIFPEGYWPKGMDASAQYQSIRDFEKSIYPICMGIARRDQEAESRLSQSEISKPGQIMLECLTTHKQDVAIHRSGIRPHREVTSDFRKKAAASDKFSGWKSSSKQTE